MKTKPIFVIGKWLLLLGIVLFFTAFTVQTVGASDSETFRLRLDSCSNKTVSYTIFGGNAEREVYAAAVAYKNGKMVDCRMRVYVLTEKERNVEETFSEEFGCVKVLLLDKVSLKPLCKNAGTEEKFSVLFQDEDGTVLSEQLVKWGENAVLPEAPTKSGLIFKGWNGNYTSVCQDTVITAEYVDETAENVFTVTGENGKVGDLVKVSVDLRGTVALCGFDMRLLYDKDSLEFVSTDTEFSFDVMANHIADSGSIRFNFSSTKNKTRGGTVLKAVFRIKEQAKSATVVKLQAIDVVSADTVIFGNLIDADYTTTEGVVRINEE